MFRKVKCIIEKSLVWPEFLLTASQFIGAESTLVSSSQHFVAGRQKHFFFEKASSVGGRYNFSVEKNFQTESTAQKYSNRKITFLKYSPLGLSEDFALD